MMSSLSRILLLIGVGAAFTSRVSGQVAHIVDAPFTATETTTYSKAGKTKVTTTQIARASNGSVYGGMYHHDGKLLRVVIEDVPNNRNISFFAPQGRNDHNYTYRQFTPGRDFSTESIDEERQRLRKAEQCWINEPDHERDHHHSHYTPLGERSVDGMILVGLRVETTDDDGEKHENESWQSDLGLTMNYTYIRPGEERETRRVVTNLRREEPDPSLFQIPKEYLSDPLLEAKTIFIDNQTGAPEILTGVTETLTLWKKISQANLLTVITEKSADLTATLARVPFTDQGSVVSGVRLQIYLRDSTNPVFEATEGSSGSARADEFAAKKCVIDLWNRVANTHVGQWPPAAQQESKARTAQ